MHKNLRKIAILVLVFLIITAFSTIVLAENDDYILMDVIGGYSISGYVGQSELVELPSSHGGKPVVAIADNAFNGKNNIKQVIIPSSVKTIGSNAFAGCTDLTDVYIKNNKCSISTSAFEANAPFVIYGTGTVKTYAELKGISHLDTPLILNEVKMDVQKRFIIQGEKLDLTGAYVEAASVFPTPSSFNIDASMVSTFNANTVGYQVATITIDDATVSLPIIVMSAGSAASAMTDLPISFWAYNAIDRCMRAAIFSGKSTTRFAPNVNMTRAEFAQMIYSCFKKDNNIMSKLVDDVHFSDVPSDKWYYTAVMACAKAGIIRGKGNDIFAPDEAISRQDAAIIMMNIIIGAEAISAVDVDETLSIAKNNGLNIVDFNSTSDYAKKALAAAVGVIFSGDNNRMIKPTSNIKRSECAQIINAYIFKGYVGAYKVYLSPSNQMSNSYAGIATSEGAQMQKVGDYAAQILISLGYEVIIAEVNKNITDRGIEANNLGCDAYVAIHSNAISGTNNGKTQGTQVFYNGNNKGAHELAKFIYERVANLTPTTDRGYKNDINVEKPFIEIKTPQMANILIEVEFHDYYPYANWIVNNSQNLGKQIAYGIDDYFKSL